MAKLSKEQEIVKLLFKDFLESYNSRNISKIIGTSHVGAFKILKRLEKREIVIPKKIGNVVIYSLNMDNPVTCKEIEMTLTIEAQNYKRWVEEFKDLDIKSNFVILFGSVIKNERNARDIDLLIVADKFKFKEIRKTIVNKNRISNKKIHYFIQTLEDFKQDVKQKNKTIVEVIKKGIVLFGQDEIRKIMGGLYGLRIK